MIPPCLTLSNIRYVSRVKWSNSGKGIAPSPTPRCSGYWKGSLLVALDYSRQVYLIPDIGIMVRVFTNDLGDVGSNPKSSRTKDSKIILDTALLSTQHYKIRIQGKVSNPEKGIAASSTPWCSSYRKGSLRVTFDYGRQLYFFTLLMWRGNESGPFRPQHCRNPLKYWKDSRNPWESWKTTR